MLEAKILQLEINNTKWISVAKMISNHVCLFLPVIPQGMLIHIDKLFQFLTKYRTPVLSIPYENEIYLFVPYYIYLEILLDISNYDDYNNDYVYV